MNRVVRSGSGVSWKVISFKPFTTSDGVSAVRIKYETDLDLSERAAVRTEAFELFADARTWPEGADVDLGIITAMSPIKPGWKMERDKRRFRIVRQADGTFAILDGPGPD